MAICSSFCPRIPNHFRGRPISLFPIKPLFSFSFKAFSSQTSASTPKADEMPSHIGFLGLGIMGSPMAQNLIKAGCNVTVWNRTKSKCDPLISLGAKYKSSPEEVAASCDVTFSMLADPESAMDVACGEHGAAKGMSPGKGYYFVVYLCGRIRIMSCQSNVSSLSDILGINLFDIISTQSAISLARLPV